MTTPPEGPKTSSDGSQVPVQATSAFNQETSEEVPTVQQDFMRKGAPISDPGEALRNPHAAELNRLNSFLMEAFPREMGKQGNSSRMETPVDVVIRLLKARGALPGVRRCAEQYCNLPDDHDGQHGFVNY